MARQALDRIAVRVGRKAFRAQRDGLIDAHPLADHRRFADHDARAVVDEKSGADGRARMDVDAGFAVRQFSHDARQQRQAQLVKAVRHAVVDHGLNAGVAQQHLIDAARRRIALESGQHVAVEQRADARQRMGKFAQAVQRLIFKRGFVHLRRVPGFVAQLQPGLRQHGVEHRVERVADVKVFAFLAQIGRSEAHRKQRAAQAGHDLRQRVARRQLTPARLDGALLRRTPVLAHVSQLGHHLLQIKQRHFDLCQFQGVDAHAGNPAASKTPSNSTELK